MPRFKITEVFNSGASVVIRGQVFTDAGANLGTQDVTLSAQSIMAIVDDEGLTMPQKQAALRNLFIGVIQQRRAIEGQQAVEGVCEMLPSLPYMVTFALAPWPEAQVQTMAATVLEPVPEPPQTDDSLWARVLRWPGG